MARGEEGEPLQTAVIEDMTVGWTPFAPPHATIWQPVNDVIYAQGPIFEQLDNMRWHDGVLERRQSVKFFSDTPGNTFVQPPLGAFDALDEIPYHLFQIAQTQETGFGFRSYQLVFITSSDIWKMDEGGTWIRLTPVYGGDAAVNRSVSVANGSTSVSGIGISTLMFLTRGVTSGQHILLGPSISTPATPDPDDVYEIAAVTGETTLTLNSPHATGFSGVCNVIRTFAPNAQPAAIVYAQIFNGDLYVAGSSVGGFHQPAVIKIPDIYTIAAPRIYLGTDLDPPNYLMAEIELEEDMAADGDAALEPQSVIPENLIAINGLQLNQDGRVQVLTEEEPDRVSRFRYSSPTNQQQWVLSPGGFTDIVSGGTRVTEGLGRLGRIFTVHYWDTIALGQPTGQDDPPLAFDSTRSQVGTAFPRSIQVVGGREFFVDYNGNVWAFDGSTSTLITDVFRRDWRNVPTFLNDAGYFAFVDTLRHEYCFAIPHLVGTDLVPNQPSGSILMCVNWDTGQSRRETYKPDGSEDDMRMTAASAEMIGFNAGTAGATKSLARRLWSMKMDHPSVSSGDPPFGQGEYIRLLEENGFDDTTGDAFQTRIKTLPLDFGFPGVYKTIERVILYTNREPFIPPVSPEEENWTVSIQKPGPGAVPLTQQKTRLISYDPGVVGTQATHFEFDQDKSSESWVFNIGPNLTDRMLSTLQKVVIRFQVLGEDEAVFVRGGV